MIDEIYYIQKKNDLTMIYTKDKEYDIWESISTLYNQLKSFHIEKVNQSTLVNLRYIQSINHKIITLNNDIKLNLSIRLKPSFINLYEEYLLRNL